MTENAATKLAQRIITARDGYTRAPGFLANIASVCLRCAGLVFDEVQHDAWHRKVDR